MENWQTALTIVASLVVGYIMERVIQGMQTWHIILFISFVLILGMFIYMLILKSRQQKPETLSSEDHIKTQGAANETIQNKVDTTIKQTTVQSKGDGNQSPSSTTENTNGTEQTQTEQEQQEDEETSQADLDSEFDEVDQEEVEQAIEAEKYRYCGGNEGDDEKAKQLIMPKPMPLVTCSEDGVLSVEQDTLKELRRIETPMCIIAVVGKLRTGKSYFLNALFNYDGLFRKEFPVGHTSDACTKGIWVWVRKHPLHENRHLVVLDTEGLFDPLKRDDVNDRKLFCFATLLSSCLVFNIIRNIDETMLNEFKLVTDLTKYIQNKSDDSKEDFRHPRLIILIRDANLTLVVDGKKCSNNEYLENTLKEKGRRDSDQTRTQIKKFFPRRSCLTVSHPTKTGFLLNAYYFVTGSESEFDRDIWEAVKQTYHLTKTFPNERNPIANGKVLANIASSFVELLNEAKVSSTAVIEDISKVDLAVDKYMSNMQSFVDAYYKKDEPINEEVLTDAHTKQAEAIMSEHRYMKKKMIVLLEHELSESFELIKERNSDQWKKFRATLLEKMCLDFDYYFEGGGYSSGFEQLKKTHTDKYYLLAGKTLQATDEMQACLARYEPPSNTLYWKDTAMMSGKLGAIAAATGTGAYAGAGTTFAFGPLGLIGGGLIGGAIGAAAATGGVVISYVTRPSIEEIINRGRKVMEERRQNEGSTEAENTNNPEA